MSFALALILPFLLGVCLLRALGLRWRFDRLGFIGQAWCAGAMGTALVVFAAGWFDGMISQIAVLVAGVAGIALVSLAIARRVEPLTPESTRGIQRPDGTPIEEFFFRAVVTVAIGLVIARIVAASGAPVMTNDEGNFWALKAKMIFVGGGFGQSFRDASSEPGSLYNADYPNLNPLLQVWMFAWAGRIVHAANRFPIQLFALAQVLIVAGALRRFARPSVAAAGVLVLVMPPEARRLAELAHGDLLVATGICLAVDAWWSWRAHGKKPHLRLAALAVGLALFAKNDGVVWLVCFAIAFSIVAAARRLKPGRFLPPGATAESRTGAWRWLALPAGVYALNSLFNAHFGFASGFMENDLRDEGMLALMQQQFPERAGDVTAFFLREIVFSLRHSSGVFGVLFVGAVLSLFARGRDGDALVVALAIAGGLAALGLVFVGAPHDLMWHLTTAAGRVAFQLFPVALLVLVRLSRVPLTANR